MTGLERPVTRIKLLTWDGQGFCLYYKVLETGRFPWPSPADGVARLTAAQMAMLCEGIKEYTVH
ncbi:IS66 family insertion sequence element accessory protein TnpB [Komagataeibacter sp. FXV3]|uniref:IS66 family insertion sequence element accessory protein TnpB n=1 Tax=Komagataeibacter sp. FXV3 TaxID=2608998 RepID=UPI00187B8B8C|nr:IS66 family insertion sequence element accessory protein TnpB [Komagataeibacter sp. FXV3]MBE7731398.1 IS66 family insertion sequence element accessory protein TnpB [Komagataeibacter sp. FXV3]